MRLKHFINGLAILVLLSGCDSSDEPGFNGFDNVSGNIETIAGSGPDYFGYEGDGNKATEAKIGWLTGISIDADGNVFMTDGAANTLRMINISNGQISTVAGNFRGFNVSDPTPFAGDGGMATSAHLNVPMATSVDFSGDVYVSDAGNNIVRKVSNGKISTLAGTGGSIGYYGDGGQASSAKLYNPGGIVVGPEGHIYFADSQNNALRKIESGTGIISTIAGQGPDQPGYTGDNGPADAAKVNAPFGIAIDKLGTIYFADAGNNVIRKISNGTISTFAGTGAEGYSGDGGPAKSATFLAIKGIAVDNDNNVFVADAGNNVIRKIASTGIITTYVGNGSAGYSGDGGPATAAQLNNPWGVAVDGDGNLYIADSNNSAVRYVAK
ncbi:MAG TPA: hypothetical protein VFW11_18540 [Cyclobacteriaceae bacterium]|nr:hypothetical protein [Cyclobacteriaceae bacterium]